MLFCYGCVVINPFISVIYGVLLASSILILTAILSLKVRGYNDRIYIEVRNKEFIDFEHKGIN